MAEIRIDFRSQGGAQTLKTLDAIATNAQKSASGVEALAKAFNELQRSKGAADGLSKSFKDLTGAASQAASQVNKVAAPRTDTKGILSLSKAFQVTYGEAQKLVQQLGLSGNVAAQAAQRFNELRGAGATTLQTYEVLSREFGLNAQQLKTLNKAYQDFAVKQAVAARSTQQFGQSQQKAYNDASKAIADLASKVAQARQGLASDAETKQASRSAALFAENLRYKQEMAKIQNSGFSPQDVATAQQLANELNKLNIQRIEKDFSQLSATAKAGLQQIAVAAGAVATAVAGLFAGGLKEYTQFDRALRQSAAVAGATEEEMAALSAEVERLGTTTTKAPAEIAQMSTELARAGFTGEQTTQALEGIVFASEATGESLSTVGDIIAKTLRVFNKSASESGEVADLLVQTANSTNTSVGGLGDSLRYVGQQAASSNQELESTLIALGLLGDAGIQGTQAGSNLAAALDRLKIASAGSVTQFQGLVRGQKQTTAAFEAIGAQVRDEEGNLKQFPEILKIIRSQLQGLAKEDQEVLLRALFGVQGGRAFGTLLNASQERIDEVTASIQNAQGAAGETSERLRQGLSGAVSLFQGTASTFLSEFGKIAAVPVEPLVRTATDLLRVFNDLPAPIQGALVTMTGFVGVLATATLAIAAYNLANGALIKRQLEEAAAVVYSTAVTKAKSLATAVAEAGELAWALATRTATTAQQQQATAIAGNIAKFGLLTAAIGSVALAVREYQQSTQALEGSQAAIDNLTASTLKLKEAFADAAEGTPGEEAAQLDSIAANIESVRDGFNQVDKILEAIREKIGLIPDPIREVVSAFNPLINAFGDGTTKLEAQLNNQSIAFEQFRQDVENDVLGTFEELANAEGGLAAATPEQLAAVRESIDTATAGLEEFKETTPEAAFAVDVLKKSLNSAALAIEQQKDAQLDVNEATEEGTEKVGEQIKALEEQQRAAKEAADDARADAERQLNRQLDDERRQRQEDNAEEIADIQKQNAEEIAQIEKQNAAAIAAQEKLDAQAIAAQEKADALALAEVEKQQQAQLQEVERRGAAAIADFEEQRQSELQDREERFQRNQQQEAANFAANQRRIEEEFQTRLNERTQAQDDSFTTAERIIALRGAQDAEERRTIQEQARVAREIQNLNLADQIISPERLAQLAQTISGVGSIDNEEEAQRAQETLGLIQEEQRRQQQEADRQAELALQAQLQAQEAAFQKQQQGEELAFQGVLNQERSRIEAEVEQRRLDFETTVLTPLREAQEQNLALIREGQETRLNALREAQATNLTAIREAQEVQLNALRERQEIALEERRSRFEAQERELDRQAEDEKIRRDREYREEQRRLDLENAQAIADIRTENRSTPAPRNNANGPAFGLRKGGVFEPGQAVQLHKDEYVIPAVGGRVVSQVASKAIARQAAAAQAIRPVMAGNLRASTGTVALSTASTERRMQSLEKTIARLDRTIRDRPPAQMPLVQNFPANTPQARRSAADDAYYWMRKTF